MHDFAEFIHRTKSEDGDDIEQLDKSALSAGPWSSVRNALRPGPRTPAPRRKTGRGPARSGVEIASRPDGLMPRAEPLRAELADHAATAARPSFGTANGACCGHGGTKKRDQLARHHRLSPVRAGPRRSARPVAPITTAVVSDSRARSAGSKLRSYRARFRARSGERRSPSAGETNRR